MSKDFSSYWKDDFHCLQQTGKLINEALRQDEQQADLEQLLDCRRYSHLYFPIDRDPLQPSSSNAASSSDTWLRHQRSHPIPAEISRAMRNGQYTQMGLAAEARLVWIIVDTGVYLWSFEKQHAPNCYTYIPTKNGQCAIVAAIVRPNTKEVYKDPIEWCLVIATIDRVFVVALLRRLDDIEQQFLVHGPRGSLEPVWTEFSTSTDGARITAITGTPNGRIFLGGNNGQIWEMACSLTDTSQLSQYQRVQQQLEEFYDGDIELNVSHLDARTGFLGGLKRAALGMPTESQPRAKTRKIDSSIASAVVPLFVQKALSYFDGKRHGYISKIAVDTDRNMMYAITSTMWVTAWTMNKVTAYISGFNVEAVAVEYLQRMSRGQKGSGAHFSLIGPMGSAQAAVGGSEGARAILKQHDREKHGATTRPLAPVSVHAIPLSESRSLTTVIVTASGLRLYVSAGGTAMKLRHMRAAIPTSDGAIFDDDVGGMKPTAAVPGIVGVGGACYWNRTLVVAATEMKRDIGTRAITTVYTASRDERFKKATNADGEEVLIKPSGIAEAVSWPLGDALQGGLVYDMAQIPSPLKPSKFLQDHAKTPTEAELATSLTPAFVPSALHHNGTTNSTTGQYTLAKQVNTAYLWRTFFCSVLGLTTPHSAQIDRRRNNARYVHYRISKRDTTRGFSSTAAEKRRQIATGSVTTTPRKRSASSKSSKPALLRRSLLHPEVKPIKDLASQCFEEPSSLVALSPSGVHLFEQGTVLHRFIAILASTDGIDGKAIHDFFLDYGKREACALCLAVAIGIGPASSLETVRTKAKNIAFERGSQPTLEPKNSTRSPPLSNFMFNDSLVPDGYEFQPSVLCQGLTTLVSRLIRPMWHKPMVVVTEGIVVHDDHGKYRTPAKVELLVKDDGIGELLSPLISLEHTLRDLFVPAIKDVPGSSGFSNRMDIEEENLRDSHFVADSQQYNRHITLKTTLAGNLSARDEDELARLLEEKNIHSIYRLVARLKQLLQLFAYLLRIESTESLTEINWGLLHGVTTAQLVENPEGQDRLERLLNGLLSAYTSTTLQDASTADRLASCLASDCFYFFSPASRDTYEGLKQASKAATVRDTSPDYFTARQSAREYFISAAENWHKPSLVVGSTGESNGSLFQARSPLVQAVNAMMALNDVAGCVHVCFKTAANFQTKTRHERNGILIVPPVAVPSGEQLQWERSLYHNKRDFINSITSPQNSRRTNRTTPRSPKTAQVVKATAQDAVDLCYKLIFQNLSLLMRGDNENLARTMLSACLSTSDNDFLPALFSFLFDNGFKKHLFDIELCPALVDWLREKASQEDLWCYFTVQEQFVEAGQLAVDIAVEPTKATPLADRINWLNRSVSSFKAAPGQEMNVKDVEDKLVLAKLQWRIADKLGQPRLPIVDPSPTAEESEFLQTKLASWSTLFNDYAAKFDLHEECLYILHANRHLSDVIKRLWMNIICVIVFPCATTDPDTYSNLMKFANEADAQEQVKLLHPGERSPFPLFEGCRWGKRLQNKISDLGRDLYGTGADFVFPVDFLVASLEALRQALRGNNTTKEGVISPGWSLVTLADGGVPFMKIWECYDSVSPDRFLVDGPDFDWMIERVCAVLELLEIWLSKISSDGAARAEFSQAKSSGSFYDKLNDLKDKIAAIPTGARERLASRLKEIEENTSSSLTYFD